MKTPAPQKYQGMLRSMMLKVVSCCRCLRVKNRKLEQLVEALGDDNRWFAAEDNHGKPVTAKEAVEYYLSHGGPEGFAKRMEQHQKEHPWYAVMEKTP